MRTRLSYKKVGEKMHELPKEVKEKIFKKLDIDSLYNLSQVDYRSRNYAEEFFESKSKTPDWRRDLLAESGMTSLVVEKRLTNALNTKFIETSPEYLW